MPQPEHASAARSVRVPPTSALVAGAMSSMTLFMGVVALAARGVIGEIPATIIASAAALIAIQFVLTLTLTAASYRTPWGTRFAVGALACILGGTVAMLACVISPDREIRPEQYGAIARTVDRQPYAASLLAKARADGIVTNEEQDAFYKSLRSPERERVLKGVIDDTTPIRRS